MIEKRREARIDVESLPDCLKTVVVIIGFFQEYTVETVDASNSGMSFLIEGITEKDLHIDQEVTIKVLPYNYKLKARVIYCKEIGDNKLRFGVNFIKEQSLEKYHELLELDIYK